MDDDAERLRVALRWRLVLGRHAERPLPEGALAPGEEGASARAVDRALDFLYDRDLQARGHRWGSATGHEGLTVPEWLSEVRRLFPTETVEVVERDAIVRFGLGELVSDPELLARLEPTDDLLRALLVFREHLGPAALPEARRMVRRILDRLTKRIRFVLERGLRGRRSAGRAHVRRTFRNVHWHRTIRRNLEHWDPERHRLVPDRISFHAAQRELSPWHVVLAVDASGSMMDSVIHAAVCAAVLAGIPAVSVSLLVFDHRVVDLTPEVRDPLEVLFRVQLGGGTLLRPALEACAARVTVPHRTLLAVVSDFFVGDGMDSIVSVAKDLHDSGVYCLGLCALDAEARPRYEPGLARALADVGWWVGAVTPERLAELLARRMGR